MMNGKCLIIAEAGVNHNGRLDLALKLCDEAKKVGADVVKFQTWKTENLITRDVEQAEYQKNNTGNVETQFEMLKKLELSYNDFKIIKKYCDKIGILFSSTADEPESLEFLLTLGIPFIKVGSGDIGNVSFLRYIGSKKKPVILSTGMSSLADVEISINALREGGTTDITVLHCTTNYPCPYNEVNLRAMITLKEAFHLPIGYSDHTVGSEVAVAAVALGAKIVEKHFTLSSSMQGPDHAASTDPKEFTSLVNAIRNVEACLGNGIKAPTSSEKMISEVVTKRIVANKPIVRGELFSEANVCVKRSGAGVLAKCYRRAILSSRRHCIMSHRQG